MSATLRQVAWASGVAASAQQALREAAIAARDSGESISAIAEAAGTTRQTIYRWVAQEEDKALLGLAAESENRVRSAKAAGNRAPDDDDEE